MLMMRLRLARVAAPLSLLGEMRASDLGGGHSHPLLIMMTMFTLMLMMAMMARVMRVGCSR